MSEPLPDLRDVMLAGLAIKADRLAESADNLDKTYRFSRQLKFIIAGFAVIIVGLTYIALVNLSNGHATREAVDAIKDCTTVGGSCNQRSAQTTAAAVGQIVAAIDAHTDLVFIATLECARRTTTDTALETCLHAKGIR